MPKEALEFLNTQRIRVISVTMPDGSPHVATMHFAYTEEPFTFIFITSPESKKGEALKQEEFRESFVVGNDESAMKTFQLDGLVKSVDTEELRKIYFGRFPEKEAKFKNDMIFTFTPTWWRFTDYKAPGGKLILSSE